MFVCVCARATHVPCHHGWDVHCILGKLKTHGAGIEWKREETCTA